MMTTIKMLFSYLFVRRLAIDPHRITAEGHWADVKPNIYRFQWQKLPEGYRWF